MLKYKAYRKQDEHSYTLGTFPTIELLKHKPEQVLQLIISPKFKRTAEFDALLPAGLEVTVDEKALNRVTKQDNILVAAVFSKSDSGAELAPERNHLVLVSPEDMGNVGTIMRTMLAFNIGDLGIVRPAVDIFNPKLVRAAMGANFSTRTKYFDSFAEYQQQHPNHAIYPFLSDAGTSLTEVKPTQPYALVFGSESSGLDDSFRKIGNRVKIPQSQNVDSLNLAIAAGIALYEFSHE